ncbi:MAG TPA: RidA family protein [bacterium]|jgi:2-iminobutanoate/2-iminopropanoate deaminase|nr:RidA family protein [bacterium]
MERKVVLSGEAPKPIGPYSQAIEAGGFIFCSGQIPLDPQTGQLVTGDIKIQTERILTNLEAVLAAAGSSLKHTVKLTVYLTNLGDFETLNKVLGDYFTQDPPARAVVQVSALPKNASVEIDLIALKK